jgi:hypothetical protein
MILRLSSPAAGIPPALLASMLATALTYSGIPEALAVRAAEAVQPATSYRFSARVGTGGIATDQGARLALPSLSDSLNSIAWTHDRQRTPPWTEVELLGTSGNEVRERHLSVPRPSAKFPSKNGGPASMDEVSLVPQWAENTKP